MTPLSRRAFRCYKALEFYNRMGSCHPSQETLAKRLKTSIPTIERAIRELRKKGWISIQRRPNTSSIYTLLGAPSRDGSENRANAKLFMRMELNLMGPKSKSDGSGDGSGDGSIPYIPEATDSCPSEPKPAAAHPPSEKLSTAAEPDYGLWGRAGREWAAYEQRLEAFARNLDPKATGDELARLKQRIEDEGLLESGAILAPRTQRKPPANVLNIAAFQVKPGDSGR